jgi:hypothetical protein
MTLFELEIDELSQAGSEYMALVSNELRRVAAIEKTSRKLTQQAIADKIKTSRSVVNREISGLENVSSRRVGELLWAMGYTPHFEARKITHDAGQNEFDETTPTDLSPKLTSTNIVLNANPEFKANSISTTFDGAVQLNIRREAPHFVLETKVA